MELPDPIHGNKNSIRVTTNSNQLVLKKAYSSVSSSFASLISFLKASITNFLILPDFWPYLFRAYLRTSSASADGNLNENTSSSSIDLPPNILVCYFTFKLYKLNPYFLLNFLTRKLVNFKYYFHLTITCKLTNFHIVSLHGHRGFLFSKSPPFYEGRKEKQERRRIKILSSNTNNAVFNVCAASKSNLPGYQIETQKVENDGKVSVFNFNSLEKNSINSLEKNSMNYNILSYYLNVFISSISLHIDNAVLILDNAVFNSDNAVLNVQTWRI